MNKKIVMPGLIFILVVLSCAPYKMKAIRAHRDKRNDLAIEYSKKHLRFHQRDEAVIEMLNKASRAYFLDLKTKISHFEKLNNWDKVVQLAEQGQEMLSGLTDFYGVSFPTRVEMEYLKIKSYQSKLKQADDLYAEALDCFEKNEFENALKKFEEVKSYASDFKETNRYIRKSRSKLAEGEYAIGMESLNAGNLESALTSFMNASAYVPDFLDVQQQINQIEQQLSQNHYDRGRNFYETGNLEDAYSELNKAVGYQAEFYDAAELLNEVKNKLTVRLAVFPFSAAKMDSKFGGIVSQKILSNAMPRKGNFILFLERENLQKIFEEQALSQTGVIDEKTAVKVGQMSGVNTIVVGSVTLVSHQLSGPASRTVSSHYEQNYRDPKGVQRTRKVPFNYTARERERRVEVALNYRLVSVESGSIIFNETLTKQVRDKAEWITCSKKFVSKLSASEREKMKASQTPESKDSLIEKAISDLSNQAASKIISKVSPL